MEIEPMHDLADAGWMLYFYMTATIATIAAIAGKNVQQSL